MNWGNRFRLAIGLIIVFLVLLASSSYLTYHMTRIDSRFAELHNDTYGVGSDYSGIVVKQYVREGDRVKTGQPVFTIKSNLIKSDIANGPAKEQDGAYGINADNQIILKATNNGTVEKVNYLEGAFVPANQQIATIASDNSLYIIAKYKLSPPDYARIKVSDKVVVTLPNNEKYQAIIFEISVETVDNITKTIVKARLDKNVSTKFGSGTPVSVRLKLDGKSFYDQLSEKINELLQPRA